MCFIVIIQIHRIYEEHPQSDFSRVRISLKRENISCCLPLLASPLSVFSTELYHWPSTDVNHLHFKSFVKKTFLYTGGLSSSVQRVFKHWQSNQCNFFSRTDYDMKASKPATLIAAVIRWQVCFYRGFQRWWKCPFLFFAFSLLSIWVFIPSSSWLLFQSYSYQCQKSYLGGFNQTLICYIETKPISTELSITCIGAGEEAVFVPTVAHYARTAYCRFSKQ